jgi:superkiller protein 3
MMRRLLIPLFAFLVSALFFISPVSALSETASEMLKEGIELTNEGEHKKALDIFNRVIEIDPEIAHAYAYRSLALIQLGRLDGAIKDSKRAMELSQGRAVKLLSLSNLAAAYIKKAEYRLAVKTLEELISIDGNDPIPYFLLGEAFRGHGGDGNLNKAMEYYTRAIELDERYALAYYYRAVVKRKLGNEEGAVKDFETACGLDASFCDR